MPCPSTTYSGTQNDNLLWQTWNGRTRGPVGSFFRPNSLGDLVLKVREAGQQNRNVRAIGSSWSFEEIAYSPDWMISLERLNRQLTHVVPQALTTDWANGANGESLIHMEAGITVADLNGLLANLGLALPTMGGSNGQSLAGVVSTGTHGSDIASTPLPDIVMAMHIVADGGQEYWIERASAPITNDADLASAFICADARIVRNDDLFNAAVVGLGRFGIIYSMVLRVVPAFRLAEFGVKLPTPVVLAQLRIGTSRPDPLRPLLDLLPPPPPALGAISAPNPRYVDVGFDSLNTNECVIRRRWRSTSTSDLNNANSQDFLCSIGAVGVSSIVRTVLMGAGGFAAPAAHIMILELDLALAQNPQMSAGDMMALALSKIWNVPLMSNLIPVIAKQVIDERFKPTLTQGKVGRSDLIMSGFKEQSLQTCFRADSIEPVFDAHSPAYLEFLDAVIQAARNTRQSGYWAMRWSQRSNATLSMHNFPSATAVAIEITSLKGLPDNDGWMLFVESLALARRGRPHWGQQHKMLDLQIGAAYGMRFDAWRNALADFGAANTFSTPYTRRTFLEPTPGRPPSQAFAGRLVSELRPPPIVLEAAPLPVALTIQGLSVGPAQAVTDAAIPQAGIATIDQPPPPRPQIDQSKNPRRGGRRPVRVREDA